MKPIFQHAWQRFGLITAIIGDFQGRLIALLFYFTVLVPFGIGSALLSDPLRLKAAQSAWQVREDVPDDLESAKRQG